MKTWSGSLEHEFDVIVVGSGAIGLTAALAASSAGATVAVFEKASYIGGTSAVSGGMIWIPGNHYMQDLGLTDSPEDALDYLRAVTDGRTADEILDTLIRRGTEMLQFIEQEAGLTMSALGEFPDYHPDWPGSTNGGRSLEPDLFDLDASGLELTVEQFNADAVRGVDPRFHRGENVYDRYWGDQEAAHPSLGPLEQPPFYGIEVFSGVIGTKGGIATDGEGRALDPFDDVIPGLFAAGNTTSHPMGPGYPGAGATLGPGMTMGYAAGRRAGLG